MSFLALMITLVLAFAWDFGSVLHRDHWFLRWQSQLSSPLIKVLLAVLLPAIAAQLVLNALQPILFGLAWIGAASLLLLYSLGRGSIGAQQEKYRSQCRRDDFEAAYLYGSTELGRFQADDQCATQTPVAVHNAMQRAYLYQAYQGWFAVLFYFLLLGPAGALAYRLLQMIGEDEEGLGQLLHLADWAPGRLLTVAFAVTGNFVESADELLAGFVGVSMESSSLLYSVAMAATGEDQHVPPEAGFGLFAARQSETFEALVRRSGIAWLVVISALVLLI